MHVRFGLAIPTCCEGLIYPVPFASPMDIVSIAVEAEELDYHSVWGNEHITTQHYVKEHRGVTPNYYDPLMCLSFIAGSTSEVKLATGVCVLPLHDPIILAKQVATLDVYSVGRVILGVGIGAYKEEYIAANPQRSRPRRADVLEERILALRELFEKPISTFNGEHVRFKDVELKPKPLQKPLPIYLGGNSKGAMKRAALYGQGWHPATVPPAEIRSAKQYISQVAREAGRSPDDIDIAPQLYGSIHQDRRAAQRNFRASGVYQHLESLKASTLKDLTARFEEASLVGNPDDVIRSIQSYVDAGVKSFPAIIFAANDVGQLKVSARLFAKDIMPSFR